MPQRARSGPRTAASVPPEPAPGGPERRRRTPWVAVPIEPDERVATMLADDEAVISVHCDVLLDRRFPCDRPRVAGALYLTTRRLVHLGVQAIEIPLDVIEEAGILHGDLLLHVGDGRAITVAGPDMLSLRAEIAAARRRTPGARGPRGSGGAPEAQASGS